MRSDRVSPLEFAKALGLYLEHPEAPHPAGCSCPLHRAQAESDAGAEDVLTNREVPDHG